MAEISACLMTYALHEIQICLTSLIAMFCGKKYTTLEMNFHKFIISKQALILNFENPI
jgi:hypothetical protein